MNILKKIFKRKSPKLEKVIINFLEGDGYKEVVSEQSKQMQKYYWEHKELERKERIKEKYDYLSWKTKNNIKLTDNEVSEYNYVKFVVEKKFK